jgi:hypothetical protein
MRNITPSRGLSVEVFPVSANPGRVASIQQILYRNDLPLAESDLINWVKIPQRNTKKMAISEMAGDFFVP